jgi:ATP-dependent Clp protease ATP-binding subunit ClpA
VLVKKIELSKTLKTKNEANITIVSKDVEDVVSKMAHIPSRSATKSDLSLLKKSRKKYAKKSFWAG